MSKKTLLNPSKNILKFWRDVEIFTLPDLSDNLFVLNPSSPLPWTLTQPPLTDAKRRYKLYFGKQKKSDIITIIENLTGDTEEKPDWLERVDGNTYMAVITLEEDGTVSDEGGYLQASYLHGIKSLQDKTSMDKIPEKLEKVQEEFIERHNIMVFSSDMDTTQQNTPLKWEQLQSEIGILNSLGIIDLKFNKQIYCESYPVSKKLKKADTSFLNSFFLDDLNGLINREESWNDGLKKYLGTKVEASKRNDLLKDVDSFFRAIDPAKMPTGRWPSNPKHGAYSAQLGAMNTALKELQTGGIMGINGPPGTGKTTLLSDIISEIVVQRAKNFVAANNILMFMPGIKIQRESDFLTYYPIKEPVFGDSGIVVASYNNAAAENISKELPDKNKIHSSFENAAYFTSYTTSLIEKESWGLLAVAFGNAENRGQFKSNFWYDSSEKKRFSSYLWSLSKDNEKTEYNVSCKVKFDDCKTELNLLIEEFETFRRLATKFHGMLPKQLQDLDRKIVIEKDITSSMDETKYLKKRISEKSSQLDSLSEALKDTKELISLHQLGKPSLFFFQKLFNTKNYQLWNQPFQQYLSSLNSLSQQIQKTKIDELKLKDDLGKNQSRLKKLISELNIIRERINSYLRQKQNLQTVYGISDHNLPDENLYKSFEQNKDHFHKSNPWSSEKLNNIRSNIFLKSLEIHELAVQYNAKQFRNNITILLEMLDGKVLVSKKIATSVWKTFFFLIPVVSTTLASVSRLFNNLEEDSIGWLLLDEAGQAPIQSAAGIISRSKRSLIIGDPLQIEPVVTTPGKLIEILNRPYKNGAMWLPKISSTQQLADRVTNKGTEMKLADEENIWTGFPLRTHMRCADPMFSISNHIAYGHQMVKATQELKEQSGLGPSTWFHVNGKTVENKQVIREEIELLKEKLAIISQQLEIFIISPFKSVANKCQNELTDLYPKVKFGTIHTFQGKEADVVFLVLGSDPKSTGARNWASKKPNMLNVALTRAKQYFYVIGNRELWQSYSNFDYLSEILP